MFAFHHEAVSLRHFRGLALYLPVLAEFLARQHDLFDRSNDLKIENFEDSKSGSGTSILIVYYVVYVHAACCKFSFLCLNNFSSQLCPTQLKINNV